MTRFSTSLLYPALALLLTSCAIDKPDPKLRVAAAQPALADVFDCLRENRLGLVSAHRGQPDPLAAENALSSFKKAVAAGPLVLEIDIARTADGELVLMHDDTLDRTTTGRGLVSDHGYAAVRSLRLRDGRGRILPEQVPSLDEALTWARRTGTLLQLDLKKNVQIGEVVDHVRRAGVAHQVILIAYTDADRQAYQAAAPDMMVSASAGNLAQARRLASLADRNLLGFTGISEPDRAVIDTLEQAGLEAITGTLGRPDVRLDDRYMADGSGEEYAQLVLNGTRLIASDRPVDAWKALKEAKRDGSLCVMGDGK